MNTFVIIPTYNEIENLPLIVDAVKALRIKNLRILVVDDSSPDGTGELADRLSEEQPDFIQVMHREGKLGLGTAYIAGFRHCLAAGADRVVQMDADFSHNPSRIPDLLDQLQDHDLALGSRYVRGGALDQDWAAWRKGLSSFGNLYARLILGMSVLDLTGGFRAWRSETLAGLPLSRVKSQGYAFQVEMTYLTHLLGFSIKEIPIYFAERLRGDSKMSLRIQLEAARRVWAIRWQYRDIRGN